LTARSVTVKGKASPGGRLRAVTKAWGPGAVKLTYRWYKNGQAVRGATGKTYRVRASDAGARIAVRVTGVRSGFAKSQVKADRPVRIASNGH
jgi:hypothetical protein